MTDTINNFILNNRNLLIAIIGVIFLLVVFFSFVSTFFKRRQPKQKAPSLSRVAEDVAPQKTLISDPNPDVRAIAGDDIMVTQLDLARAYIELGQKKLAKQILEEVQSQGSLMQQQAAERLLASL